VLLGIDLKESRDKVDQQVRNHDVTFTNLLDEDGDVSAAYGVSSTPMKFIIDPAGNMVGAALGYRNLNSDEFKELISLLSES
jgi:peroxiredoxin